MRPMLATLVLALMLAPGSGLALEPEGAPAAPADPVENACSYGVTMALLGQWSRADSAFLWVLSQSRGDPRALTNLGNLALLRGEPDLALSYYERAAASDSTDAGIVLNEATALMILGEEDAAQDRATEGIRLAGGIREAGSLLGLSYANRDEKAHKDPKAYLSKDELTSLLRAAAGHVPRDSTQAGKSVPRSRANSKMPVWRSAGARAGDQDAATLVYWKR